MQDRPVLEELYPRLASNSMLCLGAREVMGFLGRKLRGQFKGQIVTDLLKLAFRSIPGARVKHRVKESWLKMYDKVGVVLRVETVINSPEEFRVSRRVTRKRHWTMQWIPMLKGVAYPFRHRDVSMSSNSRYLDALAVVSDQGSKVHGLEQITRRKQVTRSRAARASNLLARDDVELFQAAGQALARDRDWPTRKTPPPPLPPAPPTPIPNAHLRTEAPSQRVAPTADRPASSQD